MKKSQPTLHMTMHRRLLCLPALVLLRFFLHLHLHRRSRRLWKQDMITRLRMRYMRHYFCRILR